MARELILYPCYFDAEAHRSEGRRVSRSLAVRGPTRATLEAALKRGGFSFQSEEKPHPAHWTKKEGRVVVPFEGPKSSLIRKVAHHLRSDGR
ncbi:MAG: signal recognition particle subunit SRP19/SEC65 family protein [Methanomicrobiales archaeon]